MSTKEDEELKQQLYYLFGQNYLDGDKVVDWRATTLNALEVKDYIDEFIAPFIKSYATQKFLEAEIDSIGYLLRDFTDYCDKNNIRDDQVFAELVAFVSKKQLELLPKHAALKQESKSKEKRKDNVKRCTICGSTKVVMITEQGMYCHLHQLPHDSGRLL